MSKVSPPPAPGTAAGFDPGEVFAQLHRAGQAWFDQLANVPGGGPAAGGLEAWWRQGAELSLQPLKWWADWAQALSGGVPAAGAEGAGREAPKQDKRFDAPEWKRYPLFDYIRKSYQMTSKALLEAVEGANLDPATKKQMVFLARQFVDAASPANYALTNPEVLQLAIQTRGENFRQGLANLAADLKRGHIAQSDETAFAVGENVANTPGGVVLQNDVIQLLQYSPTTPTVHAAPILIVSSIVNKYYLMDLSEDMSLVRYLVGQGFTVFITSYRNMGAEQGHLTWDDYVQQGVLDPIEAVRQITGQARIHTVGYCTGGALLGCGLSVLAVRGEEPALSMTLLMSLYDASDPGEIGVYLDRGAIEMRDRLTGSSGILSGKDLTRTFSSLRANDMVWGFVVNNYLKGKTPDAFNLFYWNTDDVNVPWPMFSYYLRECYLDNKLIVPGAMTVLGTPVDLRRIRIPSYVFAAMEDHLVPWKTAHASGRHLGGEVSFVLGGGGHITGPINPVSKNKRNYWVAGRYEAQPETWLASAKPVAGSWWPHWSEWLLGHDGGRSVRARKALGSRRHPVIEAAPGRFARMRTKA
ncbi:MAG: alpha/beta fold hydrolase [Rubrivivax sp.]